MLGTMLNNLYILSFSKMESLQIHWECYKMDKKSLQRNHTHS